METRLLGRSDLALSLVGLGCSNFGRQIDYPATELVVARALDLGINHFDTADIYGGGGVSEEFLGKALGPRRKDIVLVTKFGLRMASQAAARRGSRDYVRSAVEASLRRLGTEWIDLLFMHVPDPSTPIAETLRELEDLRRSGKVRHVGASNFNALQLADAANAAGRLAVEGFVGCQDELSLLRRGLERKLLPQMKALGLGLIPYRPLAGGALSGKYRKGAPIPEDARYAGSTSGAEHLLEAKWIQIEALRKYAEERGHTLLELSLSWLARKPLVVSIITGATRAEQLDANVKSTGWALTDIEMAEIDRITGRPWWRRLVPRSLGAFTAPRLR